MKVRPAGPRQLGLVHLYTGDGKGKTTAALGLALRASGQGMRVCVLQFMKGNKSGGEHKFLKQWPAFEIVQPSQASCFSQSRQERLATAQEAVSLARSYVKSDRYDLLILDEALTVVHRGLLSSIEILDLIASKPDELELVLTGRGASQEVIEVADLVTEMVAVKHPLASGVRARKGIEY
ncbi:MAG: cob(I)yrinic acid a,c-diamide adenosyltransferase [Dehalococcoidia bacterium]|nr:cob(I)yrinic acid a,c-diamide adenosyltransferase [Dehalococcoidia bacterium]